MGEWLREAVGVLTLSHGIIAYFGVDRSFRLIWSISHRLFLGYLVDQWNQITCVRGFPAASTMRKPLSPKRRPESVNSGLHPGKTFAISLKIARLGPSPENFFAGDRFI